MLRGADQRRPARPWFDSPLTEFPTRLVGISRCAWRRSVTCCRPPRRRSPRSTRRRRPSASPPGRVVLDVREPDEFEQGAIAGRDPHPPRPPRDRRSRTHHRQGRARSSSTAPAACGRRSPPARCRSSATPTSCRWPAASAAGRTRAAPWSTPASLTAEQRNRYKRHLLLPEVGVEGQQKLLESKVLLLGAGGLGSPAALYLAAAGVGTIGIVDMDVVDESNLQRQILHNVDRIGDRKVDSAKKTLDRAQPRRQRRHLRHPARRPTTSSTSSRATTWWSTAPTTSRPATCSTTPA